MTNPQKQLEGAVEAWQKRGWPIPKVLAVAGSGLTVDLGNSSYGPAPLSEILPFPVHGIEGHPHAFEIVHPTPDRPVLYLRGRLHAYQDYDGNEVTFVVRLARLLGAELLLMSNAAGGLNSGYRPGDLVLIHDHLNLSGRNPLLGSLPREWGPQFPSMENAYDSELREFALAKAHELGIPLQQGVYSSILGPCFETPAEIRMLRTLGADLSGMSTVQEVIAARHMGMRCLCMSLVANLAAGVNPEPLNHEEVLEAGRAAATKVKKLWEGLLKDPALLGEK
ncbi:MAG: purine-nucleoside phosphorylase [Deltaproteobacteria bacterium]|nr:purine-nucleoside phosphorylase [Deltaproteobacteria bacterium]